MTEFVPGILIYGGTIAALLSINIIISLMIDPRLWIQDLPKELQAKIPPKSSEEKRRTILVMLPFIAVVLTGPAASVTDPLRFFPGTPDFVQSLFIGYGTLFMFNLADLVLIDWLIICTITPRRFLVPGIDASEMKDYRKHFYDFLKGIVVVAIPGCIGGAAGYLYNFVL